MSNTVTAFFSFSPNTKARSTEVNSNFNIFRGSLIPVNTDTATASNGTHTLGNSSYSWKDIYLSNALKYNDKNYSLLPKGAIISYPFTSAPSSTLLCDGSSISRTTYSELFDAVTNGNNTLPAFGYETSTHFNLPDLRGKLIRGVDSGAGNDPDAGSRTAQGTNGFTGDTVGSIQNYATGAPITTITTDTIGSHTHYLCTTFSTGGAFGYFYLSGNNSLTTVVASIAGSHVHTLTSNYTDTKPKNLFLNYFIYY